MSLVIAQNLRKDYEVGETVIHAIRGVDFAIEPASFACFIGPSGSGKTTLLNMIGCLDRPTSGVLNISGTDVTGLDRKEAAIFRGENIGFVFQDFNLIPVLTAHENIEYPLLMVQHWPPAERHKRVASLLEATGIAEQAGKRPDQLSGGQKQRVAVARALVTNPKLVLADEPTANLDHETAYRIIDLMKRLRDEFSTTFIFSTHDPKIMSDAEVRFEIEDGRLQSTGQPDLAKKPVAASAGTGGVA
jgi:putative ABC transport system ATP-binding protein